MGIPVSRIIEKLDQYLYQRDFDAAERHLRYWLADAEAIGDKSGAITVLNEQIGFYRKQGRREEALAAAEETVRRHRALGPSVGLGTTLLNAATAYKAFGLTEEALPLYEESRSLLEARLPAGDGLLGGLYNNMALALLELGEFRRAEELFRKALAIMERLPEGECECAVTYCNLADLAAAEQGLDAGQETIEEYLRTALSLLRSPRLTPDGHMAYVCEKCAPIFAQYGMDEAAAEIAAKAEEIYARA